MNQNDAVELNAYRAAQAKAEARYHGWRPLPIWYTCWAILIAIGGISSGSAGGVVGGLVVAGLLGLYVRYLYRGGKYRVWFVVF
jgi:hypothetical protein